MLKIHKKVLEITEWLMQDQQKRYADMQWGQPGITGPGIENIQIYGWFHIWVTGTIAPCFRWVQWSIPSGSGGTLPEKQRFPFLNVAAILV